MLEPLVTLEAGWALWPVFEVRAAGFPIEALVPLHAAQTARALAHEQARAAEVSGARAQVMDLLHVRRRGGAAAGVMNKLMEKVRKLQRGLVAGDAECDAALGRLDETRDALELARAQTQVAFGADASLATAALKGWLEDSAFRRALLLQNRGALKGGLEAWRRGKDERTARRGQQAVATYLQRYTTKNDTVGFFGPVGWGHFTAEASPVLQRPGPTLVEHVCVHLEPWAVAALADVLAEQMGKSLVPRISPRIHVQNGEVHGSSARSLRGTRPLPDSWKAVFAKLHSAAPPTLDALCLDPLTAPAVTAMVEQGVLEVRLPVTAHARPHDPLERQLEQLDARQSVDAVASLEQARAQVEAAFGEEHALDAAMANLDAEFLRLTGETATRNPGQTYGSRTLTYANCRRSHALFLGAPVVELLAEPLALLLDSARWFTFEAARAFLRELAPLYRELSNRLQSDDVPMVDVYGRLVALFEQQPPAFLARTRALLEQKWAAVLQLDGTRARQHFEPGALRALVTEHFAAPGPGLPLARHHSPDVMLISTPDGWEAVVGETHAGVNTLGVLQAVDMHPHPAQLRALFRRDIPGPCVSELQHDDYSLCAHDSLLDETDFHLDTGSRYSSWLPAGRTLALSDFMLREEGGYLRCLHGPTGKAWDVLQVLEKMLRLNLTTEFHLPSLAPHSPRVTLGKVVVARESWTLDRAELLPLLDGEGLDRLRAANGLRSARGLPRFVFAKIPREHKPLYVDFESPVGLDVFCRMSHDATTLRLSEMLPLPADAWLNDAAGQRFVSELRVVAVDPREWRPIPIPEAEHE